MYHALIRKIVRRNIEYLNSGNFDPVLRGFGSGPSEGHNVAGNHALGGTRYSVDSIRRYFERLHCLLPGVHIDIKSIVVSGGPWRTLIAMEWTDHATVQGGFLYTNQGVQIIKICWGRVVSSFTYPDTQRVSDICRRLDLAGVNGALSPPIEDLKPN